MAHVLILGMTESGKTTLARTLAQHYKRNGVGVLVLDPLSDPRWPCDFVTADSDEFLDVFWRSRRCVAFMDEGGESVGRYNTAMQATATRGRHWGHSCHFIAQRATQLAPIVRDQCTHLFLFCSSLKDGEILADEWNKPELAECAKLRQGEYIHAVKFGASKRHTLGAKSDDSSAGNLGRRNDRRRSDSGPETVEKVSRSETGTDAGTGTEPDAADRDGVDADAG